MSSNPRTNDSCGAREACLEMEALVFIRILTSASLLLIIAAMAPFSIGCESLPDMSAPVAVSDVTATRAPDDPASDDFVIISPSTLVLESQGWGLTVHVAIPYSQVVASTVNLDGIEPVSTFADDCGNLVCKFEREDIFEFVGLVNEPTEVPLTVHGDLVAGGSFSGSDTITVR